MIFIEKFNPKHFHQPSPNRYTYRDCTIAEKSCFNSIISSLNEVFPDCSSLQENLKNKYFCVDNGGAYLTVEMFHTREEAVAEVKKRLNDDLSCLAAQMEVIIKRLEDLDKQGGEQEKENEQ